MSLASSSSQQKHLGAAARRSARHLWRAACARQIHLSSKRGEDGAGFIGSGVLVGPGVPGPTRRSEQLAPVSDALATRPGQQGAAWTGSDSSCFLFEDALQSKAVLALAFITEDASRSRTHEGKWAGPAPPATPPSEPPPFLQSLTAFM